MAGGGAPTDEPVPAAPGLRVAIVAASWHAGVMAGLVSGAERTCSIAGATAEILRVPGSFELPVVADAAAASARFDAVVALGVVVRGGTPHFEYVCQAATDGLSRVALDRGVPVGFGLLTCDTVEQALDRSGGPGSSEDKGAEAAQAAIATALVLRSLRAE